MSFWTSCGLVTAFFLLGIGIAMPSMSLGIKKNKFSKIDLEGLFLGAGPLLFSLIIFSAVYDEIPNHFSRIIGVFSDLGIVTTLVGFITVFILVILATLAISYFSNSSDGDEIMKDQHGYLVAVPKLNSNIFITFGFLVLFLGILAWSASNNPASLEAGLRLFTNPLCCGLLLFTPMLIGSLYEISTSLNKSWEHCENCGERKENILYCSGCGIPFVGTGDLEEPDVHISDKLAAFYISHANFDASSWHEKEKAKGLGALFSQTGIREELAIRVVDEEFQVDEKIQFKYSLQRGNFESQINGINAGEGDEKGWITVPRENHPDPVNYRVGFIGIRGKEFRLTREDGRTVRIPLSMHE